jgi:hypothetical protein
MGIFYETSKYVLQVWYIVFNYMPSGVCFVVFVVDMVAYIWIGRVNLLPSGGANREARAPLPPTNLNPIYEAIYKFVVVWTLVDLVLGAMSSWL